MHFVNGLSPLCWTSPTHRNTDTDTRKLNCSSEVIPPWYHLIHHWTLSDYLLLTLDLSLIYIYIYMCVYTYTCVYIHICVCIYVYIYIYIYMCVYRYICIYMYICVCIYICVYIYVCIYYSVHPTFPFAFTVMHSCFDFIYDWVSELQCTVCFSNGSWSCCFFCGSYKMSTWMFLQETTVIHYCCYEKQSPNLLLLK